MTLIERLKALAERREMEGFYTDANICVAAVLQIEGYHKLIENYAQAMSEALIALHKLTGSTPQPAVQMSDEEKSDQFWQSNTRGESK